MATYIKGDPIANATSYELFKKTTDTSGSSTYTSLATASEINFKVEVLGLNQGDHTFVVKVKADGYEDSDYSNEVSVNIPLVYTFNIFDAAGHSVGSFQCYPDMSWAEWCDSKYNTADFRCSEGKVYYSTWGMYITNQTPDSLIVMAADYTLTVE